MITTRLQVDDGSDDESQIDETNGENCVLLSQESIDSDDSSGSATRQDDQSPIPVFRKRPRL